MCTWGHTAWSFFAAGSLSLPLADMDVETGAETDTEIDELLLEIAGNEEGRSVSEPGGEISAFCALSCMFANNF